MSRKSGPRNSAPPSLAELRRRLGVQAAQPARKNPPQTPPPDEVDPEAGAALFRAAVGDAQPLPATNRAEIPQTRPVPLPRPQPPELPAAAPPGHRRHATTEADYLRQAMADVAPLRDTGRVEPVGPFKPRRPGPGAASTTPFPTELPSDLDPNDPAALFRFATQGANPVEDGGRRHLEPLAPAPLPKMRAEDDQAALRESLHAPLSFEDRLDMGDEAAFLQAGLPRRVLTDLRRGRWVVQGEVDLHGLTREEARAMLSRFLTTSLHQGLRCLRVIHGKGLGSPGGVGLLKQLSKGWLAQRQEILAFCQAKPHDGGSGALLVLLRAGGIGGRPA